MESPAEGIAIGGFSMSLAGDVPLGAGLSSSGSVEVATAMALLGQSGVELPLEKIATLCRRAENEHVGAKSGIMDQFVVAGGVAKRAMLLDCRSLKYELLPLPTRYVVICNWRANYGGGFGGCTMNIVKADRAEHFVEAQYFVGAPEDGALALASKSCVE